MRCDNCGQESDKINKYNYYYGKKTGQRSEFHDQQQTTTTEYSITGSGTNNICDDCCSHFRIDAAKFCIICILISIGAIISSAFFKDSGVFIVIILFLFLGFGYGGIMFFLLAAETKRVLGGEVALKLHREELTKQGFDVFFTDDSVDNGKLRKS